MKNFYSVALFLLGLTLSQAQVYVTGDYVQMTDVSNNGVAVGSLIDGGHVKWTEASGQVVIGELSSENPITDITSISDDGAYISGTMTNPGTGLDEMARYNAASETWSFLGGIGGESEGGTSSTWGISGNGSVVVGLGWIAGFEAHAIKWSQEGGIEDLGTTVEGRSSRANGINNDGTVIVGWQDSDFGDRLGVYWKNGVQTDILDNNGENVGEAQAVTPDGKTIVGFTLNDYPFIWKENGEFTEITHPDPSYMGAASGITDDGKTVVGFFRPWGGPAALGEGFIYTEENGLIELNEYVASLGLDNQGVTFALPMAISPNGEYITGIGRTEEDLVGFVIKLPVALGTDNTNKTKISIYPNPMQDVLYVNNADKITNVEVYNMVGQQVLSNTTITKNGLDVSKLTKGAYVIKITSGNQTQSIKVLKK